MDFKNLTSEQIEKAKACETTDDLVELARAEGMELSDEQLDAVVGGDNEWYCACNQPTAYSCTTKRDI